MFEKKNAAITKAEKLLSERAKIQQAIGREVAAVSPLISALLEAQAAEETDLGRLALTAEEAQDDAAPGEGRAVAHVRSQIERQARKLSGLRRLVSEQAGPLADAARAVSAGLPAHVAEVRRAFVAEWQRVASQMETLLSRRRAVESLVGHLELPPLPTSAAATAELDPSVTVAFDTLGKVESALSDIAGWTHIAHQPTPPHPQFGTAPAFDPSPSAIYEMVDAFGGFERGAFVCASMFEPGILAWLHRSWQAVGIRPDGAAACEAASQEIAASIAGVRLPLTDSVLARPPAEIEQWRRDSEQASAENQREAARTDSERLRHHQIYPN